MTKGISAVISVVLLLLIALGLVMVASKWLTSTTTTMTATGSKAVSNVVQGLQVRFTLDSIKCIGNGVVDIYLRNTGDYDLKTSDMAVYFDDVLQPGAKWYNAEGTATITTINKGELVLVNFTAGTACDTNVCNHRVKVTHKSGVVAEGIIEC